MINRIRIHMVQERHKEMTRKNMDEAVCKYRTEHQFASAVNACYRPSKLRPSYKP